MATSKRSASPSRPGTTFTARGGRPPQPSARGGRLRPLPAGAALSWATLLVRAARSLGLRSPALFRKVILPSAVPTIFTGIRMAGTSAILVLIAAEMVGAKAGLGYLITNAQNSFLIPQMYAGILTVSLLGLLVNVLLVTAERHFSRWRTSINS